MTSQTQCRSSPAQMPRTPPAVGQPVCREIQGRRTRRQLVNALSHSCQLSRTPPPCLHTTEFHLLSQSAPTTLIPEPYPIIQTVPQAHTRRSTALRHQQPLSRPAHSPKRKRQPLSPHRLPLHHPNRSRSRLPGRSLTLRWCMCQTPPQHNGPPPGGRNPRSRPPPASTTPAAPRPPASKPNKPTSSPRHLPSTRSSSTAS